MSSAKNIPQPSLLRSPSGLVKNTTIDEEYMLVKKPITSSQDEGKDSKSAIPSIPEKVETQQTYLSLSRMALKNLKGQLSGKGGRLKEYPFILPITATFTSSAAAAQAFTQGVIPGSSGDFSALAGLFDEFICDKAEVHWDLAVSNSNTADIHAGWAYDPIDPTAYASVVGTLEASQHHGPVHVCNSSRNMNPLNHTPSGMWIKTVHMPKGPAVRDPATPTVTGTGTWTSTSEATTAYGYIKGYSEAPSGGLTTVVTLFIRMFCRFRSRT